MEKILDLFREAAQSGKADERVRKILEVQGCEAFLTKNDDISSIIRRQMRRKASEIRYNVCKNFFFELGEIPYAIIKGAVLSQKAYGDPGARICHDIDILIDKDNQSKAENYCVLMVLYRDI